MQLCVHIFRCLLYSTLGYNFYKRLSLKYKVVSTVQLLYTLRICLTAL